MNQMPTAWSETYMEKPWFVLVLRCDRVLATPAGHFSEHDQRCKRRPSSYAKWPESLLPPWHRMRWLAMERRPSSGTLQRRRSSLVVAA